MTTTIAPSPNANAQAAHVARSQARIARWWEHELSEPIIDAAFWLPLPGAPDLNCFWPTRDAEPDLAGLARAQYEQATRGQIYAGDAIPTMPHSFGGRGTPGTACMYIGATTIFQDDTVWVEPHIDDLADFDPQLDPANDLLRKSLALFAEQCRISQGEALPLLPGLMDALTALSLMRGPEHLCLDLLDCPAEVHRIRDQLVENFIGFYQQFLAINREHFPGTVSWLAWAPGTTYPVQCDFSTMISPEMFRSFVVPELDRLSTLLSHMIWHLDGEEELPHLDILLDRPDIKAIQWNPCSRGEDQSTWYPLIKRILAAGKGVFLGTSIVGARRYLDDLPHRGLFLRVREKLQDGTLDALHRNLDLKPWTTPEQP